MAYTQADLDRAKEALALGVSDISSEGVSTSYRSIKELKGIIKQIESELGKSKKSPDVLYASVDNGFQ